MQFIMLNMSQKLVFALALRQDMHYDMSQNILHFSRPNKHIYS